MSDNVLNVLQFTDTHLFAGAGGALCGLNTQDSLRATLDAAKNLSWPPDLILVTGDLTQDFSVASYERFREFFDGLGVPVYCLPGNHDDPGLIRAMFAEGNVQAKSRIVRDDWQILMLNSTVPKKTGGHLPDDELAYLKRCLEMSSKHALVCMHHSPLPLQSAWMDKMIIHNAASLFQVIDAFPHVRGVLWGHVHQAFDGRRGRMAMMATPSTSIQFAPKSAAFQLDGAAPGYRWLRLHTDGRIETAVERVSNFSGRTDLSSTGY